MGRARVEFLDWTIHYVTQKMKKKLGDRSGIHARNSLSFSLFAHKLLGQTNRRQRDTDRDTDVTQLESRLSQQVFYILYIYFWISSHISLEIYSEFKYEQKKRRRVDSSSIISWILIIFHFASRSPGRSSHLRNLTKRDIRVASLYGNIARAAVAAVTVCCSIIPFHFIFSLCSVVAATLQWSAAASLASARLLQHVGM